MKQEPVPVVPINEKVGAVLNEAMSNGCACLASDLVGAAPFLIDDGRNGLLFRTGSVKDLTEKVCYLINNPSERASFQKNAY